MPESNIAEKFKGLTSTQLNALLGTYFTYKPINDDEQLGSAFGEILSRVTSDTKQTAQEKAKEIGDILEGAIKSFLSGHSDDIQRRNRSEILQRVQEELKELLPLSHLTTPGVEALIDRFSEDFKWGLRRGVMPIESDLSTLLGIHRPGYGGIFILKGAKRIERQLYLAKLDRLEMWVFVQEGRASSGSGYYDPETLQRGKDNIRAAQKQLAQQQAAYKEKYKITLPRERF